jgi:putative hemolysin
MTSQKTDRGGNALAAGLARPVSYGRKGALEVRLACSPREIDAAQAVRYRVFYEEMSATPDAETRALNLRSPACRRPFPRARWR